MDDNKTHWIVEFDDPDYAVFVLYAAYAGVEDVLRRALGRELDGIVEKLEIKREGVTCSFSVTVQQYDYDHELLNTLEESGRLYRVFPYK